MHDHTNKQTNKQSHRRKWAHLTYNELKVYIQKQIMSIKSGLLLLLFYKISIPIYAFLPVLQNLKDASAVEVHSSSSQPALHGFLDCLVSLVVVTFQVIFQGPQHTVVWGGQIWIVGWMGEKFPAVILNCLQGQMCSARPHIVMKEDDSFLLWMSLTKCMMKFVECLNVVSWIYCFSFSRKLTGMHPSLCQKTVLITLPAKSTVFSFVFLGGDAIPCFVIDDPCQISLFHKKFNDSMLMKQHVTAIFSQCMRRM